MVKFPWTIRGESGGVPPVVPGTLDTNPEFVDIPELIMRNLTLFALVSVFFLGGCFGASIENPPAVGIGKDEVFEDIPTLKGFERDQYGKIISSQSGDIRSLTIIQNGKKTVEDAVVFYRNSLPKYNWERKEETGVAPEPVTLVFVKHLEQLTVNVRKKDISTIIVEIRVGTRESK